MKIGANTSVWLNVFGFCIGILVGALFLYGALVKGHRLRAPVRQRVLIAIIGLVGLYFGITGLFVLWRGEAHPLT